MGYAQYLRELLAPLRVYDLGAGSFSGGEVESLGTALDGQWSADQEARRESLVTTAEGVGLEQWEQLFPHRAALDTVEARRSSIGGFLSISGDSFTQSALQQCLRACGAECILEETGTPGTVSVRFRDLMGEPENFAAIKEIIEEILPCHLLVEYRLQYCTWEQAGRLTWAQAGTMTWAELRVWNGKL